jgi:hypothetical protein
MVEELGWSNRVSAFLARIETRREDYTVRIDSTASDIWFPAEWLNKIIQLKATKLLILRTNCLIEKVTL